MPWCPKCWAEYPKDFTACHICDEPLTDIKPEGEKPPAGDAAAAPKKRLPRYLRRAKKA